MKDTNTKITTSTSKDETLTLIISGNPKNVEMAKMEVAKGLMKEVCCFVQWQSLQLLFVQAEIRMTIPQEHYGIVIGKGGQQLQAIQDSTGVSYICSVLCFHVALIY